MSDVTKKEDLDDTSPSLDDILGLVSLKAENS